MNDLGLVSLHLLVGISLDTSKEISIWLLDTLLWQPNSGWRERQWPAAWRGLSNNTWRAPAFYRQQLALTIIMANRPLAFLVKIWINLKWEEIQDKCRPLGPFGCCEKKPPPALQQKTAPCVLLRQQQRTHRCVFQETRLLLLTWLWLRRQRNRLSPSGLLPVSVLNS